MVEKKTEPNGKERRPKTNHLISRKKIRDFIESHPDAKKHEQAFRRWCRIVEKANWSMDADVKATFGDADRVGAQTVFNVGGHKYRVIASIKFRKGKPSWVYIKHVLTHEEYDDWENSS